MTRVNAPYAAIRVLTGQQMSEVINVWLKKLQFVAKGFSLGAFYSVPLIFRSVQRTEGRGYEHLLQLSLGVSQFGCRPVHLLNGTLQPPRIPSEVVGESSLPKRRDGQRQAEEVGKRRPSEDESDGDPSFPSNRAGSFLFGIYWSPTIASHPVQR